MDISSDTFITVVNIVTGVIAVASLIASLTPSAKDDVVLGKIKKIVDLLALNVGNAKK